MPNTTYQPGAKFILGGDVIFDLTQDDVAEADVAYGKQFHKPDGSVATGSSTKDVDSSGCTALDSEVLANKTFGKGGSVHTGSMVNRGEQHLTLEARDTEKAIPQGFHDGSGGIGLSTADKAALIAANIRQGVTILDIEGSMTGTEDMNAQAKNVTPSLSQQTILPDSPTYNCLSQVTVAAIQVTITTDPTTGGLIYSIG